MRSPPRPLLYRFSEGLADIYGAGEGRPTPAKLAAFLGRLLGSDLTVVGHRKPNQTHVIRWWPTDLELGRFDAVYEEHVATHPVRNRFRTTRDPGPHLLSDSTSLASFRQTGLYHDYFRHFGITRLMAIYAPLGDGAHLSLGLSRGGRDFTTEERLVLKLSRPHLITAARVQIETQASAVPLPAGAFDARSVTAGAGLTARETEVFQWVAAGKTNPEIAVILGVSRWTVKTHVERILGKLGAENRVSAVALVRSHG